MFYAQSAWSVRRLNIGRREPSKLVNIKCMEIVNNKYTVDEYFQLIFSFWQKTTTALMARRKNRAKLREWRQRSQYRVYF